MKKRLLVLQDGTVYSGTAFGAGTFQAGELVFNTGMCGYQEILTDPSYCGQIITMTYPLIGNYGVNRDDFESLNPAAFGLVVRELCKVPSNFRLHMSLDEFLLQKGVPGIEGIDTRSLTKKLRTAGTMLASMADENADIPALVDALNQREEMHGQVSMVSTQKAFPLPSRGKKVALLDFGAKNGIVRELSKRRCDLVILPYDAGAEQILSLKPDGVMLSNGPGNPKDMQKPIATVRKLIGKVPIFGICLGHQLIALACGADTKKLLFGHRGCNHPVVNLRTGKVEITSQNHGYAVSADSLKHTELRITHRALNDQSVEGLEHTVYPVFSVQYHPESSPGPEDSGYLFDEFMSKMEKGEAPDECA